MGHKDVTHTSVCTTSGNVAIPIKGDTQPVELVFTNNSEPDPIFWNNPEITNWQGCLLE